MRAFPHPLHTRLLPCIAVIAVMAVVHVPEAAAAQASFDPVTIEIVTPAADPVVAEFMAIDASSAIRMLVGPEWSGLMTVPPTEKAPRLILLRSTDGSQFALGIIRANDDWSGFCIHIGVGPAPSFSTGSINVTFPMATM